MGFVAWIPLGATRRWSAAIPFAPGGGELANVASANGATDASMEGSFDFRENAEKVLADAISAAADPGSGVPVRALVLEGDPAQVLLDACDGADLLVVGSRGHGGFAEALLGSVSQHCVHHARCPVVVIRGEEDHGQ
jgi:nucleotide-binding universal stress UspA family protein